MKGVHSEAGGLSVPTARADAAVVNVPLRKRGDIDAQISRYLAAESASQEHRFRSLRVAKREEMALVKAAVAAVSNERMAELGRPYGLTATQTRKQFVSAAFVNPRRIIESMGRELGQ